MRLTGFPNPLKRLQAETIFSCLRIVPGLTILDVGCGSGFLTVELAKRGVKVWGLDTSVPIMSESIQAVPDLNLGFVRGDVCRLPFGSETVDRVLCSELLTSLPHPENALREISRVLRPGGIAVIVSGLGHPAVEKIYATVVARLISGLRRLGLPAPPTYDAYVEVLEFSFGTSFPERDDGWKTAALEAGLLPVEVHRSPGFVAGSLLSVAQFLNLLISGRPSSSFMAWGLTLAIPPLKLLDRLSKREYFGNEVLVVKTI